MPDNWKINTTTYYFIFSCKIFIVQEMFIGSIDRIWSITWFSTERYQWNRVIRTPRRAGECRECKRQL